ncbi:MAG: dUTP diphosphatase [Deltaproteobacteria bacterium]|nr:MAG: dUTP diphosphatase [Deltaproteobacteria bacterium]
MPPTVKVRRLSREAFLPEQMTPGAAGYDLRACLPDEGRIELPPGGRAAVPTGIALAIPDGYEGQIRPRSGLALRHGLSIPNAPGTIDADYRGEVRVILVNLGDAPVVIEHGQRIAQLVVAPVAPVRMVETEALPETERGAGGFGSTGL